MSESINSTEQNFWLFIEVNEKELAEIRKFIDPEIDFECLEGIAELIDCLYHLLD